MYYKILQGDLIQLSEIKYTPDYKEVVEDTTPRLKEGYYLSYKYEIIDNVVHKVYSLELIPDIEEDIH